MNLREVAEDFLKRYSDAQLVMEVRIINQIMEVDEWYDSLLQEDIDHLYDCIRNECMDRFVKLVEDRSKRADLEVVIDMRAKKESLVGC